jgi:hypothetical protein
MPSTALKSKNIAAMGTNSIEDPNPDTVPITSLINAGATNQGKPSIIWQYS